MSQELNQSDPHFSDPHFLAPHSTDRDRGERLVIGAAAMQALGEALGESLAAGDVLILIGDLGAGKTTLTQGIGTGLGIQESLESPTFTLMNEYTEGRLPLYHLDLYRLAPEEVDELGLVGYWEGTDAELGVMLIEWGDRLPELPDRWLKLTLRYWNPADQRSDQNVEGGHFEGGRTIAWEAIGDWRAVLAVLGAPMDF